jgi:hypothetical protein
MCREFESGDSREDRKPFWRLPLIATHGLGQLGRQSLSKHFVEAPSKMAYFDKVFHQMIPTKTLRHGLWDSLDLEALSLPPAHRGQHVNGGP